MRIASQQNCCTIDVVAACPMNIIIIVLTSISNPQSNSRKYSKYSYIRISVCPVQCLFGCKYADSRDLNISRDKTETYTDSMQREWFHCCQRTLSIARNRLFSIITKQQFAAKLTIRHKSNGTDAINANVYLIYLHHIHIWNEWILNMEETLIRERNYKLLN